MVLETMVGQVVHFLPMECMVPTSGETTYCTKPRELEFRVS